MANTSVYTGSDGSLTLSVPSGVEGDAAQTVITAYDTITVGRVEDVTVEILSEVLAFNEIGQRYATQLRPGNVSIRGTLGRAFINGAMLKLCLGEAAENRPAGSWTQPALNVTLQVSNSAVPDVRSILTLHAGDCLKAVRLLDKSTIDTGKKMASDPAFGLAAQLLAAKLNIVAGAGSCPAAVTAINDAQALLAATHFNGITHDKLSAAQATQANSLATTLDRYNNSLLC